MFKSFKEYRLREAAPTTPPSSGENSLEAMIISIVDHHIDFVKQGILNRNAVDNPVNVMRQNQPWHRKLGNWWNRFWRGDQYADPRESIEYDLEFSDIIPLREQEALNELSMLMMEGPVNEFVHALISKLEIMRNAIHKDIRKAFAGQPASPPPPEEGDFEDEEPGEEGGEDWSAGSDDADTAGSPPPAGPHVPPDLTPEPNQNQGPNPSGTPPVAPARPPVPPGSEKPSEFPKRWFPKPPAPPGEDKPVDQNEPVANATPPGAVGDDPRTAPPEPSRPHVEPVTAPVEPLVPPTRKPRGRKSQQPAVSPDFVNNQVQVDDVSLMKGHRAFGLAKGVMIGGKEYKIKDLKYNHMGSLESVTVDGLPGIIPIPKSMGDRFAIRYGGRSGSVKKIQDEINQGVQGDLPPGAIPPEESKISPNTTPTPPEKAAGPSELPFRVDSTPKDHTVPPVEDHDGDVWDEDPKILDRMKKQNDKESEPLATTHDERVQEWLKMLEEEDVLQYVNPKFLHMAQEPPSPRKEAIMAFFNRISDSKKSFLVNVRSKIMDSDTDLGKFDWIARLDPHKAEEVGARLNKLSKEEMPAVLQDEASFDAFANQSNENALPSKLGKASKLIENVKNCSPTEQVKHYKKKLRRASQK